MKDDVSSEKSKKKKRIPEMLPQKHFLWLICSPVRGGKTNLITNLLYNDNIDYSEQLVPKHRVLRKQKYMFYKTNYFVLFMLIRGWQFGCLVDLRGDSVTVTPG